MIVELNNIRHIWQIAGLAFVVSAPSKGVDLDWRNPMKPRSGTSGGASVPSQEKVPSGPFSTTPHER